MSCIIVGCKSHSSRKENDAEIISFHRYQDIYIFLLTNQRPVYILCISMGVLKVLLWKHFMVRRRKFLQTVIEFFVPISLIVGLFLLKDYMEKKSGVTVVTTNPYAERKFTLETADVPPRILYSPDNNLTRMLMREVDLALHIKSVTDEAQNLVKQSCPMVNATIAFLDLLKKPSKYASSECAFVQFENMSNKEWPPNLNYSIRMNALIPHRPIAKYQRLSEKFENVPKSFLRLQWAIDSSFIKLKSNTSLDVKNITFEAFSQIRHIRHINKVFISTVFFLLPYISFLAPIIPFIFLMNRLLEERATGIQELVKIVGVTPAKLGIAHFINSLPPCLIFSIGGTFLLKGTSSPMIPHTNINLLFLHLFLHFTTLIAMAYTCSYITRDAQYSVSVSMFIYIGMWIPIRLLGHESTSDTMLFFLGLLPHCPCYWFINECLITELQYEGIQFQTINTRFSRYPGGERNGTALMSYIMQLVQITLFFITAWYLEKVRPGRYGVAQPWNFLCKKVYWIRKNKIVIPERNESLEPLDPAYKKYFENTASPMQVGIKISHVTKIFNTGQKQFKALNNVTLDIYKGEITVLLGHNGAGKTTLMSIITGMINPTSGKVYVNGLDTVTQNSKVRKHIGLCPQHNLFFPDLTVMEHLKFFTLIKGGSFKEAKKASYALMEKLNLSSHAKKKISALSGGMLRRLQLGCALCGNASVLILDEPTSGLDVEARRELWDILLGLRGDRALVLTTHFMEEADVLGDRLAALHGGKLRCHGTPMFLKRAVGSGFRIKVTTRTTPNEDTIIATLKESVPNVILKEKLLRTLVYDLPPAGNLPILFTNVEKKKEELDIESLGVGITTLEEVFLKLCCDVDTTTQDNGPDKPVKCKYVKGSTRVWRQIRQLFKRQFDFTFSKFFPFLLLQVFMPFVLCTTLTKLFNNGFDSTDLRLKLNIDMFTNTDFRKTMHNVNSFSSRRANPVLELAKSYPDSIFTSVDFIPEYGILFRCANCTEPYEINDYSVGLELKKNQVRVLYSPHLPHSAPAALNLLGNLLAIQHLPNSTGRTITTEVTNSIPFGTPHIPKSQINCALYAIFNMCVIMATAINDVYLPCKERVSVARHTHVMAGCSPALYWSITFAYHMTCFMSVCCPAVLVAAYYFDEDKTIDDSRTLVAVFVVVFLSGLNFYTFSYFVSFYLNDRSASLFLIAVVLMFGFFMPILIMALDYLEESSDGGRPLSTKIMDSIGIVIPTYLYTKALVKVTDVSRFNSFCVYNFKACPNLGYYSDGFEQKFCCEHGKEGTGPYSFFAFNKYAPGYSLILIFSQFIIFTVLVLLLDYGVFNRWWNRLGKMLRRKYPLMRFKCPQVAAEKMYVNNTIIRPKGQITDVALVSNMWKTYFGCCGKTTFALRDVNFSIKKGECFGILGVNGAGKTTTYKLISKQESITKGSVNINGYFRGSEYLNSLGYCPQFSGLDDFRSGANNLKLLLTLRGLSKQDVKRETRSWLRVVGMEKYGNRLISGYSGGMVRRLATAAALCGGAPVTLLDEPTAGVDTAARRLVWDAIKRGLMHGRAIVLSSHGMDEMEMLCSRVTILNSGEMSVLGKPSALREMYAPGHTIVFKLHVLLADSYAGKERIMELNDALQQKFDCTIKDQHLTSLHYRINEKLLYSDIFTEIEAIVKEFHDLVEDYSVTDTTLEDVFLTFAHEQSTTRNAAV